MPATSAYNKRCSWVSGDQPQSVIPGKDENIFLNNMLRPQRCSVGDRKILPYITSMREIWSLATDNTQLARQRQEKQFANYAKMVTLQVGDMACL